MILRKLQRHTVNQAFVPESLLEQLRLEFREQKMKYNFTSFLVDVSKHILINGNLYVAKFHQP